MSDYKIQQAFKFSYHNYCQKEGVQSDVQKKTARAILNCKSGSFGYNASVCEDCGHTEIHNNSCRNRNCPNCQAVKKEIWVDKRRSEVIDSPYFHVVFTLPHELNPLLYCNQKLLYGLFHRCCAETLLELSLNPKYLGATPGIIQVLHTSTIGNHQIKAAVWAVLFLTKSDAFLKNCTNPANLRSSILHLPKLLYLNYF